jgi:hypothetical protein
MSKTVLIVCMFWLLVQGPILTKPKPSGEDAALLAEFQRLEREWMQALQDRQWEKLESFLAPEYALRLSNEPTLVIPRDIWLRNAHVYNLTAFSHRDFQVQRISPEVVVVSFVQTQTAKPQPPGQPAVDRSGDFYLIDIWKKIGHEWKVAARYSAPPSAAGR